MPITVQGGFMDESDIKSSDTRYVKDKSKKHKCDVKRNGNLVVCPEKSITLDLGKFRRRKQP
jgi:hypothetical protein